MKIKKTIRFRFSRDVSQHIANFGTARLVKKQDGRYELIGGTADDHAAAREWCSLFHHELVFTSTPRLASSLAFAA
jgi:hypothetical protein